MHNQLRKPVRVIYESTGRIKPPCFDGGSPLSVFNNNLTACGYINGRQHTFTIDTGATQSIIRPDVVKEKCEALSNVRLRTVAGESATAHGKTERGGDSQH